jgi:hypothetical protein
MIRVAHAAYGFGALKRWYDCAAPQVLGLPNAVLADIDEVQNRLHFGVATPGAQGGVLTVVARCKIPPQAVIVDVVPRVQMLSGGLNETVQDSVRPLKGGIKITFNPLHAAGPPCTMGIIGRTGEGLFFITAAHCSRERYDHDTASYWQPTLGNPPDFVGTETLDPPYFTYPEMGCPAGQRCRMSDANMTRLPSNATGEVGVIARTLDPSHWLYPGSLEIDQNHPRFYITAVDTSPGPVVGDSVCKTGQTSGTTCGIIQRSCVAITSGNVTMICQMDVDMYSDHGDSGSPIYHWTPYFNDSTVTLAGILWGGMDAYHTWYSQWDWVDWELFRIIDTAVVTAFPPVPVDPGPITNVDIIGPDFVDPNQVCHWSAAPTGGTPPYTYDWDNGGDGSNTYYVYVLESFWVGVTVTDAHGSQGYKSMYVYAPPDEGGPRC